MLLLLLSDVVAIDRAYHLREINIITVAAMVRPVRNVARRGGRVERGGEIGSGRGGEGEAEAGGAGEQGSEGLSRGRRGRATGGGRVRSRAGGLEVELSPRAVEEDGSTVVGSSGVLCCGEGTEPLAGSFARLSDLGDPLAPASLPDPSVPKFVVVGATFAFAFPTIVTAAVTDTVVAATAIAVAVAVITVSVRCLAGSGGENGGGGGLGVFLGRVMMRLVHWLGFVG